MADHKIKTIGGDYFVKSDNPFNADKDIFGRTSGYALLVYRYDLGDIDTIGPKTKRSKKMEMLHSALYDLYQTDSTYKDGDTFSLRGRKMFICEGVHVNRIENFNG